MIFPESGGIDFKQLILMSAFVSINYWGPNIGSYGSCVTLFL